jgi:hypothetical protein
MAFHLDYDRWIHLDAEKLAEGGIERAYEALMPELKRYVQRPAQIEETVDNDAPLYSVTFAGREFVILGPEDDENGSSWGPATFALFAIINDQLAHGDHRFYAINGGNDLGGMFLTPAQARAAQEALPKRSDWPYLPDDRPPWFGQYH